MQYRELLDFVKKNPNCFWTKEQWENNSQNRFRTWVGRRDEEYTAKKTNEKKQGHK
jgi:hypothetical protein